MSNENETVNSETPKEETSLLNSEQPPKEEAPKEEAPKEEPPKEEAPKEEPKKEDEPKKEGDEPQPLSADDIKVPEGMEVDEEIRDSFLEVMNDQEMSPQDRVQKLVDLQASLMQKASEKGSELWEQTRQEWIDEVKNDEEIGGKNLDPTLASIGKLIDHYNIPGLREAFDITEAGNHPAIVKFLAKVSKDLAEGSPVLGEPSAPKDAASILYPTMKG